MKVKIHVELITDWGESRTVEACEFARPMTEFSAETVGLSLDDGKKLLHAVQQHVQMRWSPRAAHLLAQVRCTVINGDLASRLRRWSPPPPQSSIHIVVTEPAFA
jgi:hypothetical protein